MEFLVVVQVGMDNVGQRIFANSQYIPHGHCYLWQTPLVWLHVIADSLTAIAYFSIPILLIYFLRRFKGTPFSGVILLFSSFILLCGATHVLEVITLWLPLYWISGGVKAITALVSVATVFELVTFLPKAFNLKSPLEIEQVNIALTQQIQEKEAADLALRKLNQELEQRVEQRVVELAEINQQLEQEIQDRKQAQEDSEAAKINLTQVNQELAKQVQELEIRTQQMILLGKMTDFLQSCLSIEEAEKSLADLMTPLFFQCSGGIFLSHDSKESLDAVAIWGDRLDSSTYLTLEDCWGLRRGGIHQSHADTPNLYCKHIRTDSHLSTTLCVPMMAQGETLGLLYLSAPEGTEIPLSKQQFAQTVAKQIAITLANLKLRESLQQQSFCDGLTGLYNRRYLDISCGREIKRCQRAQNPLSLLVLDLDHFKKFNDTYGHEAGDFVLKNVGRLLQQSVRSSDIVCRYGGEEFVIVCPGMPPEKALTLAELFCAEIKQLSLSYHQHLLTNLSVSIGVASFPNDGSNPEQLFRSADQALYCAKHRGRDQVVAANAPFLADCPKISETLPAIAPRDPS